MIGHDGTPARSRRQGFALRCVAILTTTATSVGLVSCFAGSQPRPLSRAPARAAADAMPMVRVGSEVEISFGAPQTLFGGRREREEADRMFAAVSYLSGEVLRVAGDTLTVRARYLTTQGRAETLVPVLVIRATVDPAARLIVTNASGARRTASQVATAGTMVLAIAAVFALAAMSAAVK